MIEMRLKRDSKNNENLIRSSIITMQTLIQTANKSREMEPDICVEKYISQTVRAIETKRTNTLLIFPWSNSFVLFGVRGIL